MHDYSLRIDDIITKIDTAQQFSNPGNGFKAMFGFGLSPEEKITRELYSQAILQARSPEFYLYYEVPDTPLGRFELIALHLFLILRELKGDPLGQKLYDLACADIEMNLREMGVNDLGVGKQVKFLAAQLQGRLHAYEQGMNKNDLAAALQRNLYAGRNLEQEKLFKLCEYIKRQSEFLRSQEIRAGRVNFGVTLGK